jgi:hypothetical protein
MAVFCAMQYFPRAEEKVQYFPLGGLAVLLGYQNFSKYSPVTNCLPAGNFSFINFLEVSALRPQQIWL